MSSQSYRTIGSAIGIGLLSGALVWGSHSLTASYASNAPSPTAMPVAVASPANGFTEVAKQVTPAVVNITTVMTEKVSEGFPVRMSYETEWKNSSENHSGLARRDRPALLNIEGLGKDKGRASSFLPMDIF